MNQSTERHINPMPDEGPGQGDIGLRSIRQTASAGAQSDLMNNERWGRRCMLQLQEAENWNRPAATTWAAEFLLREGEIRECPGSWINSNAVNEAKKRRQASNPMLISMRELAVQDWRAYESRI
jgi:hypothetical protein